MVRRGIAISWLLLGGLAVAQALPTGQTITPTAAPGAKFEALNPQLPDNPDFTAGQAVTTLTSRDGAALFVLTSGYNLVHLVEPGPRNGRNNPVDSHEFVFVYDISAGGAPVQKAVLSVPASYSGMALSPDGDTLYVAGGDDDNVHIFERGATPWAWAETSTPLPLNHKAGLGQGVKPEAAGVAVTADGNTVVVADYENDAITLLKHERRGWDAAQDLDLRPGKIDPTQKGVAGGEFPFWVVTRGNDTAFVSSQRDRQIVEVSLASTPRVVRRIAVKGVPNKMLLNRDETRLYVAEDNSDTVAAIDTAAGTLVGEIPVAATLPVRGPKYNGAAPDALALSPDERTLYVVDGGENAVAVVRLGATPQSSRVDGLIPTGWYPTSVSTSRDGGYLYIVNGKSAGGPNPQHIRGNVKNQPGVRGPANNQYVLQLDRAGLLSLPTPAEASLQSLTATVIADNHLTQQLPAAAVATLAAVHRQVHHAIYIIKENRTYDQVLGDLKSGDGSPALTEFPAAVTPNFHALAASFVTLDHFYCSGDVSGDGWPWSTAARATDVIEKEIPVNYAGRGLNDDAEGTNRDVNVALPNSTARKKANAHNDDDDDELPGTADVAAPDGDDDDPGAGYIWNAALKAHLTVRNYGFFLDLARYGAGRPDAIPEDPNPAATHTVFAYPTSVALAPFTDPYFRGFDQAYPDYYRFKEWEREFDQYAAQGDLPNLELVRLEHDHFGSFGAAIAGVNTPELQIADDDWAVGLLVDKVAHSRYAADTLIFVVEDDAQDGADHVNSHRSPAFIIGPMVKQHAEVSTPSNSVSLLRTIETVLGLAPLNLNDGGAMPMWDVFDPSQKAWTYTASPSRLLANTQLPVAALDGAARPPAPAHDAAWWAARTAGMDFSVEDRLDARAFNLLLWQGIMGSAPYPGPMPAQSH